MSNISSHDLPYHLLRIELRVVRGKEEEGDSRIVFQVSLYDLCMMEADIIQYDDDMPSRISCTDRIKKLLKGLRIAHIRNLSYQIPRLQIHRAKQGLAFLLPKVHRDYGLYSLQRPHTGQGGH